MRNLIWMKDFRRLLAGRIITNIGDSLYYIAATWLVYDLTGDPFYSGLAGFLAMAPSALQAFIGPLVDQWSIRRILVGSQFSQALLVSIIPITHYFDVISVGIVLFVMPLLSLMNQFGFPALNAALPRIVNDKNLSSANSLFAMSNRSIDMVANGVAGILITIFGAVSIFMWDAVTFLIAASLFTMVYVPSATKDSEQVSDDEQSYLQMLKEGISYVYGTLLMWLIICTMIGNFAAGILFAAFPAYAAGIDVGGLPGILVGVGAYGILMGAFGMGNLLGSIMAGWLSETPLGYLLIVGSLATAVFWAAAVIVDTLLFTALLITLALIPVGIINVQIATVIQSVPPEEFVGRVSALKGSVGTLLVPAGSLIGGMVAGNFTPEFAILAFLFGPISYLLIIVSQSNLRNLPGPSHVELAEEHG